MAQDNDKPKSVFQSIDWWTILIYLALLALGWMSVCGASYSYGDADIVSLSTRSGMQIVWIGTSVLLAICLLLIDDRFYDTFAFVAYALLLVLVFLTIFNPHSIKGSHSWLVLGPLRLQPAEFAKFATALALAKFMGHYKFNIRRTRDFCMAALIVLLPMVCIIGQNETGSALVYLSFSLMFYREGMPGSILFVAVAMVVYFVVGAKYADVLLLYTPTSVGQFSVLLLTQLFTAMLTYNICHDKRSALHMGLYSMGATLLLLLFSLYVIPFNIVTAQLVICMVMAVHLIILWLRTRYMRYILSFVFMLSSLACFYSTSYFLNNMLKPHQRVRINVLLGLDDDPSGAGYNVHQSEIAIGSGGLRGKGFLNGTQTKLKFVPEQDTDFIFCTVGEEEGFVGSAGVLLLFLLLILRLIHLAERQKYAFGRIYGYCVLSIFLFHVFINVGMVLGLTPVIGIPLPFFSYGGSSLWGFTFLLFIFLRIDAGRNRSREADNFA